MLGQIAVFAGFVVLTTIVQAVLRRPAPDHCCDASSGSGFAHAVVQSGGGIGMHGLHASPGPALCDGAV
jgi:hypothetical protein